MPEKSRYREPTLALRNKKFQKTVTRSVLLLQRATEIKFIEARLSSVLRKPKFKFIKYIFQSDTKQISKLNLFLLKKHISSLPLSLK